MTIDRAAAEARAAQNQLFANLAPQPTAHAIASLEFREYGAGEAIITEASDAAQAAEGGMYILVDGELSATREIPDGRRETLSTMRAGEFFGELAATDEGTRSATVRAVKPSLVAHLPADATRRLFAEAPEVMRAIAASIAARLRRADDARINALVNEAKLAVLGRTAAMLAHDLRGPIGVMKNAAALIEDRIGDPVDLAKRSRGAAEFMLGMVRDLMDFAKGDRIYANAPFELTDLLADVDAFALQPAEQSGTVRVHRALCENTHLRGDRRAICRALMNIVRNAAEAMPNGGEITFSVANTGSAVRFQISDTGQGIPDDALRTLFEPFATFGKRGGSGLGMALTKSAIDGHGGTIEVTTAAGAGTTFNVSIPLPMETTAAT